MGRWRDRQTRRNRLLDRGLAGRERLLDYDAVDADVEDGAGGIASSDFEGVVAGPPDVLTGPDGVAVEGDAFVSDRWVSSLLAADRAAHDVVLGGYLHRLISRCRR